MKRADINAVIRYDGELHEVVAVSTGRMLILQRVGGEPCPTCGSGGLIHVLEDSPLFQENAEPVRTLGGS